MQTPNRNSITTPLRLGKRRLPPSETPECYTKVTLETPAPRRNRLSKEDEVRNLIVAVRIRPMSFKELTQSGATNIIGVDGSSVIVRTNAGNKCDYMFDYDRVFWSCEESDLKYANQADVFDSMGKPLLDNAFSGYNASLFAYGQTGSGKTYSMMGPDSDYFDCDDQAGIIPRFCKELFSRVLEHELSSSVTINISYFEIYNEKIHDLLLPHSHSSSNRVPLKVREHPDWGPYVVDLTTHSVKVFEELKSWLLLGNKNRVMAATAMNTKSSRSHSIFSIELSVLGDANSSNSGRRSKICLVDLAGSERLNMHSSDEKLKEGVSINKSLLTLGKVIIALADQRKGSQFIPYRDSVLTWLLRESLGGNSLTSMLATITPSSTNVDETLATLRYACQARAIVNRARINNNAHDSLIRKLNLEVERLQALLNQENDKNSFASFSIVQTDTSSEHLQLIEDLKAKLTEKEEMLQLAERSWEDRYKETKQHQMRKLAEVEKQKEELESHVRIMTISNENINVEPYQSNFLEEVENVLKNSNSSDLIIKDLKTFLTNNYSFEYEITEYEGQSFLNIYDKENYQTAMCSIDEIGSYVKDNDRLSFIEHLKWEKQEYNKSSEEFILSKMNVIYDTADALQKYVGADEKISLAFAKFMKSVQVLETALRNTVNVNKPKKTVTFRC